MRDGHSSLPGGFNHSQRRGERAWPRVCTTGPGGSMDGELRGPRQTGGENSALRRLCQLGRRGETVTDLLEGEKTLSVISGASSGDIVGLATCIAVV